MRVATTSTANKDKREIYAHWISV